MNYRFNVVFYTIDLKPQYQRKNAQLQGLGNAVVAGQSSSKVCQTYSTKLAKAVHQTLSLTFSQSKLICSITTTHALFDNRLNDINPVQFFKTLALSLYIFSTHNASYVKFNSRDDKPCAF